MLSVKKEKKEKNVSKGNERNGKHWKNDEMRGNIAKRKLKYLEERNGKEEHKSLEMAERVRKGRTWKEKERRKEVETEN